ncbi:hypothetical protein [Mesorhizobium sp. B1-1-8]|uniref:hypothetical protein n=1 Tax=Mesorhizobium sp. B1-1-8 TaxID=2589976 RepID=UPI00112D3854|nr:hypothetical protein [Mesorhizobium sp. B1-1-8]UCI08683.1 hypothetical protein FJ974_06330 [Mesorhizobium sp. B1-1-8]
MTISNDELERIDSKIRSLAQAFLAGGRPYLLSQLGKDLGDDLKLIKFERSLGEYLTKRLSDEYAVILMGQHKNIQALVPNDGKAVGIETVPNAERGPRYNYRFWAAFSVPLEDGRRWFNLEDFTFKDVAQKPDDTYVEIPADLIAPAEAQERDTLIKANISKWLELQGLSRDRFIAVNKPSDGKEPSAAAGRTLLEAVIQALDRKQLSSTNLSLDVVADLLRKRV